MTVEEQLISALAEVERLRKSRRRQGCRNIPEGCGNQETQRHSSVASP